MLPSAKSKMSHKSLPTPLSPTAAPSPSPSYASVSSSLAIFGEYLLPLSPPQKTLSLPLSLSPSVPLPLLVSRRSADLSFALSLALQCRDLSHAVEAEEVAVKLCAFSPSHSLTLTHNSQSFTSPSLLILRRDVSLRASHKLDKQFVLPVLFASPSLSPSPSPALSLSLSVAQSSSSTVSAACAAAAAADIEKNENELYRGLPQHSGADDEDNGATPIRKSHFCDSADPSVIYRGGIVMPCGQRNLDEILRYERPSVDQVRKMLREVGEALQHIHERGLIHGNLKLSHVLRVYENKKQRLVLIDLTAAVPIRRTPNGSPSVECVVGDIQHRWSAGTLPPEMFFELADDESLHKYEEYWKSALADSPTLSAKIEPHDKIVVKAFRSHAEATSLPYQPISATPASDIWAFGLMLYSLLTRESVFALNSDGNFLEESDYSKVASWSTQAVELLVAKFAFKIKRVHSTDPELHQATEQAKELLRQLLDPNPERRNSKSLKEYLQHPFFNVAPSGSHNSFVDPLSKPVEYYSDINEVMRAAYDQRIEELEQQVKDLNELSAQQSCTIALLGEIIPKSLSTMREDVVKMLSGGPLPGQQGKRPSTWFGSDGKPQK